MILKQESKYGYTYLLSVLLVAVAAGGAAYVLLYPILSGEKRARKRQMAFHSKSSRQANMRNIEAANRRKQVEGSLKDIANRNDKKQSLSLSVLIGQAGLNWSEKTFYIISAIMAVVVTALLFLLAGEILYALPGLLVGGFGLPRWMLSFMAKRRIRKFIEELPNALDVITRGIKAGLPLGDCMRIIATEATEPVRSEFRRTVEAQVMGLTIAEAIERMAERVPITEVNFFRL